MSALATPQPEGRLFVLALGAVQAVSETAVLLVVLAVLTRG